MWKADPIASRAWKRTDRAQLFGVQRDHLERLSREGALTRLPSGASAGDVDGGSRSVDVAQLLAVNVLHADVLGWADVRESALSCVAYLDAALDDDSRRFRPGRSPAGAWLPLSSDGDGEDAHGQVVLALGEAIGHASDRELLTATVALFRRCMPGTEHLTRLRPLAAAVLGYEAARRGGLGEVAPVHRTLIPSLGARFERVAWSLEWPWPEAVLTSDSALPARALVVAGRRISDRRMVEMGLAVLEWLVKTAVAPHGHLSPVGNKGGWIRDGERAAFDQLPSEPLSLLLAAETAYRATGNTRQLADMERAYAWFLGANDIGVDVADPDRGACRDGLGLDGGHVHEGAEATLAWLTALEHIRGIRSRSVAAG